MQTVRIGIRQFTILVILYTIGTSILIIPSGLAIAAKQDAWIAAVAGTCIGVGLAWFYGILGNMLPGLAPVQYCKVVFGKWLGGLAAIWYILFTFILTALVTRNLGDFLITEILPDTPIQFIHLLILMLVVLAVRLGPETIARTAEIFSPWVMLFGILLITLLLPKIEMQRIMPVFEMGFKGVMRGAFTLIGTPFLELFLLLSIFPSKKGNIQAFVIGCLIAGLLLLIVSSLAILVLGADLTARQIYPTFTLAKKISIGDFLQRLEVILSVMWFITIFFKITLCFYATVQGISQLLSLSDYRAITLPLGMVLLSLSIIAYPNTPYFMHFFAVVWMPYALTVGFLLPLLLIATAKLRGVK
ncbi:GerAB/ArcD/ProY family transporter [Paenibacillus agricola]|uniref:Endospore germination permease n=1 Tax=Paenibacillus agricola TaxID=2716264 RepID=A0ABX0J5G1_9BACL|nr:endospore germination permease [Paenibacillus agricola]NHN30670.1 endospore germination permease [Paenibacillus agricola]